MLAITLIEYYNWIKYLKWAIERSDFRWIRLDFVGRAAGVRIDFRDQSAIRWKWLISYNRKKCSVTSRICYACAILAISTTNLALVSGRCRSERNIHVLILRHIFSCRHDSIDFRLIWRTVGGRCAFKGHIFRYRFYNAAICSPKSLLNGNISAWRCINFNLDLPASIAPCFRVYCWRQKWKFARLAAVVELSSLQLQEFWWSDEMLHRRLPDSAELV